MRQVEPVRIGDIRVDGVMDGEGRFQPTLSFRGTTPEQWEVHRDLLDEDGLLGFSMGGFLVRTGDRTALVDLGLGPRQFLGIQGGAFLDELAALGVTPAEVTDVLFTHLHFDHIGWATAEGRAVFPNAEYRCAQADWDHFMVSEPGDEAQLLEAATDRFSTWDDDGVLLPGIDAMAAPGHTPGSTVLVISSGTERAMLLGDVVHCPIELVDDEWASMFDMDPALARRTRLALNRELEGSGVPAVAAHFPGLRFGRLLPGEGKRRWVM
ncbi:MAG TPA: MBL fold metallo-hydrolase [Acidimicrobiales bacterium]|nr:MBL fold metallo-hydrolase [Acidimicrobiales bacterium]